MQFIIEDGIDKNYVLQLGDIVTNSLNEICSVVATYENGKPNHYFIKDIFGSKDICNLSSDTLIKLTEKAWEFNYNFFSKNDYELVLRSIK